VVILRMSAANDMSFARKKANNLSVCLGFENGVAWSRKLEGVCDLGRGRHSLRLHASVIRWPR
jgi:hypothetical protein